MDRSRSPFPLQSAARPALRVAALVAAFASFAGAASGGVFDNAKFRLDLRGDANGNNTLDRDEIGNAFDFSAASPSYAFYGEKGIAKPYTCENYPSQVVMRVAMPLAVGKTNEQTCIYFPQEPANKYCGITIPKAAVAGNSITMYTRFRPDGLTTSPNGVMLNGFNGYLASGLSIYLDESYRIGILTPGTMGVCSVTLTQGEWHDVFVVATNSTDGTSTEIRVYACKNGASSFSKATLTRTGAQVMAINAAHALTFGSYESNTTANPRAFKGAMAEAAIWDRALSENEMREVMAGPAALGGEWQIGAANGSADEFDDASPAAVYDVQSMPWRRMRKTLDASAPSLSLATTMTADDDRCDRVLTFTPILSGTESAPVEVSLNGQAAGEIDLASATSITLPRKLWIHSSGVPNTITVTRKTSLGGTVQMDAVSLAPGGFGAPGGVMEDATFKLDLRGGASSYTKPGDLGNAYDFSADSPIVGWMGDQRGPQTYNSNYGNLPSQESADVTNPYYPYTTNAQNVLHFYQDNKSATTAVRSSVVLPGAAPNSPVQTFYLRFRWDGNTPTGPSYLFQSGNAANGYQTTGVALYIHQDSVSADLTTTNGILGVRGSNIDGYLESHYVKTGEWCDLFVTFTQNAGNTAYTVASTLCRPVPSENEFAPPSLLNKSRTFSKALSFDTSNLTLGGFHESSGGANPTRGFRGLIADFMVWQRALTNEEKIEVMAGRHGAKWMVGAANGSADEFTDDDPAAVFEPESMPWRRMRRTLTAANPTLTLKSPLAAFEAGRAMLFTLVPVPDGAAHPVRIAVNGTVVGDFDAATDGTIVIPRGSWTRDGSGDVTVTATSLNTSAPLSIDAIALSGSWQNAPDDRGSNGMLNEKYSPRVAFAGDTDVEHFTSSLSVGSSLFSTNFTFGVWVPKGMGDKVGWKFRTKTTSRSNPIDGLDSRHVVYVNGMAVGSHDGWFAANEPFTLDIPAGVLRDGMNAVQWVQTLPTRAEQQAVAGRPGVYQFYDYWSMSLVPPESPTTLIVR